jgi:hypothetical protein
VDGPSHGHGRDPRSAHPPRGHDKGTVVNRQAVGVFPADEADANALRARRMKEPFTEMEQIAVGRAFSPDGQAARDRGHDASVCRCRSERVPSRQQLAIRSRERYLRVRRVRTSKRLEIAGDLDSGRPAGFRVRHQVDAMRTPHALHTYIVIPLSAIGAPPQFTTATLSNQMLIHAFGIGLPSALFASWAEDRTGAGLSARPHAFREPA